MIYLDNNATTRMAPEVREAMLPWMDEFYGNPSGGYRFGKKAKQAMDEAREKVAALIGSQPDEVVFTSGGTEAINSAIQSGTRQHPNHKILLASSVEHSAVFEAFGAMESQGFETRWCPVDEQGRLDLEQWNQILEGAQVVVANLIWANNETGVISPVAEAAAACAEHGACFHCDAVQAVGKIPISVGELPVHALSMSAHKFHGPKGVGAVYTHRLSRFTPMFYGGGQEEGRRSGTENVAGIVGMGVAASLASEALDSRKRLADMRDDFENKILDSIEGVEINGGNTERLPNTTNLYFSGVDGEGLLILLDEAEVCCSPGSACSTGSIEPSRIIKSMGHSSTRARSSVRFSFSRYSEAREVDEAVSAVKAAVAKLRVVLPRGVTR
ncbi:MAG: cysteine desulfurase family protein [Verrucomicrobiota bacterium]